MKGANAMNSYTDLGLHLPSDPVPDRVSISRRFDEEERDTLAYLDGGGCIRHIWVALARPERVAMSGRKVLMRIYFDNEPLPYVECPVADFFGVMHGQAWYPVDTHFLSVKPWIGYNCYFPMPFARNARIEFETGPEKVPVYLQVDWHRYPDSCMSEPLRFCSRWRREMPTQRYGEGFLMLDADGPGRLLGFVYGVRLLDDTDRWSHGGAENIYIDGDGEHPAFLRGIGGEDTFGAGYGGALHPPETHHFAAMPYYVHEDVGQARPAQRLVGYRLFEHDAVYFRKSIHMRFGCMANDICSTVYWYQDAPVREFFGIPAWAKLLPGTELPLGSCDAALPDAGEWCLCGPFSNEGDRAMSRNLPPEDEFDETACYEGLHGDDSPWLTGASKELGRDQARWVRRAAFHGFVDFSHVFSAAAHGASRIGESVGVARCAISPRAECEARLRIAWDDHLVVSVNGDKRDLGFHRSFQHEDITVPLKKGENAVVLKVSNQVGFNVGGWAFAFQAQTIGGERLLPRVPAKSMR